MIPEKTNKNTCLNPHEVKGRVMRVARSIVVMNRIPRFPPSMFKLLFGLMSGLRGYSRYPSELRGVRDNGAPSPLLAPAAE